MRSSVTTFLQISCHNAILLMKKRNKYLSPCSIIIYIMMKGTMSIPLITLANYLVISWYWTGMSTGRRGAFLFFVLDSCMDRCISLGLWKLSSRKYLGFKWWGHSLVRWIITQIFLLQCSIALLLPTVCLE